jgi:hypothetical protein
VPDAQIEKFVLELKGGRRYGLLENSEDICRKKQVAGVYFQGQNGSVREFSASIANDCGRKKKRNTPQKKRTGVKKRTKP